MRNTKTTRWIGLGALASALCLVAGSAFAIGTPPIERVRYQLEQGSDGGFGFSLLHDADDSTPMSGHALGNLHGDLTFDYDPSADLYTLVHSSVYSDSAIDFAFTAGAIAGDGGGYLDYVLSGTPNYAASARILFQGGAPVCCGVDGPNYVRSDQLRLWGASDVGEGNGRIGLDLGGSSVPLPEPSAALLFAIGGLMLRRGTRPA